MPLPTASGSIASTGYCTWHHSVVPWPTGRECLSERAPRPPPWRMGPMHARYYMSMGALTYNRSTSTATFRYVRPYLVAVPPVA